MASRAALGWPEPVRAATGRSARQRFVERFGPWRSGLRAAVDKSHSVEHIPAAQTACRPYGLQGPCTMVSFTQRTWRRRNLRDSKLGRDKKKERERVGTPKFPVHPQGYDPQAPDAKKSQG